jgi:hypothetical protein
MATDTQNPLMPKAVSEAISKVMGGIEKLAKDNKNAHGNYNFVSVDDFIELVNPLCAAAGLIIVQDEGETKLIDTKTSAGKESTTLLQEYRFYLCHSSGVVWDKPITRRLLIQITGPQTFGAAQSYALKSFMRSLFQIPTGDKDGDDIKPDAMVRVNEPVKKDLQAEATRIRKELMKAGTGGTQAVLASNGVVLKEIKDASESAYDYLLRYAESVEKPVQQGGEFDAPKP